MKVPYIPFAIIIMCYKQIKLPLMMRDTRKIQQIRNGERSMRHYNACYSDHLKESYLLWDLWL